VVAISVAAVIFFVTYIVKPEINWGSAGEALRYVRALDDLYDMTVVNSHVKNFRCVPCRPPVLA
jgi:hypothetical protein